LGNGVKLELVLIPAGKFTMGSPKTEAGRNGDEGPQHEVTISKPFYMGRHEVTQEQYEAVMGNNPANFKGAMNPVEQVSWHDAQNFCRKLGAKAGRAARLPTEAEWEYACRAGTTTSYHSGDDVGNLDNVAWHRGNSGKTTHPMGQKMATAWGLFDMHGNVWEWCQDWHLADFYKTAAPADPVCAEQRGAWGRVIRGGAYRDDAPIGRAADREWESPDSVAKYVGFRIILAAR
jgi:formylglycine-generating enzyme required for sulfatase activity